VLRPGPCYSVKTKAADVGGELCTNETRMHPAALLGCCVKMQTRPVLRGHNDASRGHACALCDSPPPTPHSSSPSALKPGHGPSQLEPGEAPEGALCRELHEELGIGVSPDDLRPLTFASHAYDDFHLIMPVFGALNLWDNPTPNPTARP